MDNNDIRNRSVQRDDLEDGIERNLENKKNDRDREATSERAPGDILGISHVTPTGDDLTRGAHDDGHAHQPPLPEERDHVGSRDVTESTTGGTGPDTGGHGVFRRGSGATGTDLGNG